MEVIDFPATFMSEGMRYLATLLTAPEITYLLN